MNRDLDPYITTEKFKFEVGDVLEYTGKCIWTPKLIKIIGYEKQYENNLLCKKRSCYQFIDLADNEDGDDYAVDVEKDYKISEKHASPLYQALTHE